MGSLTTEEKLSQMTAECLLVRLRILLREVNSLFEQEIGSHGVRASQLTVLGAVASQGGVTSQRLGEVLHMDASTVSRAVARLQAKGLLQTTPSGQGKVLKIEITEEGLRKIDEAFDDWLQAQQSCRDFLGDVAADAITELGSREMQRTRRTRRRSPAKDPS